MHQGIPVLYVDGSPVVDDDVCEAMEDSSWCVQTEFDDVANGYIPGWCNSAAISYSDDELTVSISLGDPRGAFTMTARRLDDGSVILHVPHDGDTSPHVELTPMHPGTYRVYGPGTAVPGEDDES